MLGRMHVEVPISGDTIKLGQLLKLANLAESGGQAKEMIEAGEVTVNGEVVTSRGFLLHDADVISTPHATATVTTDGDGDDDYFDERTANDDFDPEKWRNM